jgi:hypothetical protein
MAARDVVRGSNNFALSDLPLGEWHKNRPLCDHCRLEQ